MEEKNIKEWTIMVYMAGDNNLSEDMVSAINDIEDAVRTSLGSGGYELPEKNKIAITAQYDCGHPIIPTQRFDFTKKIKEVDVKIDENASTGKLIENFVKWSVKGDGANFHGHKAKNYALILSGHGDGFQGRTLLIDENPFGVITVRELSKTIEKINGFLKTPEGKKTHLKLIGFDSCLMNSIEVLYELRKSSDIWISSQGNIPNSGWEYKNTVSDLYKLGNSLIDPVSVVKTVIRSFKALNTKYNIGGRSVDLSACYLQTPKPANDYKDIKNVAKEVNNLGKTLNFYFDKTTKGNFSDVTINTVKRLLLQSHWSSQTFMVDQSIDIWDFCDCLSRNCAVALDEINLISENRKNDTINELETVLRLKIIAQCEKTKKAVQDAVIFGAFSGADYQYCKGISLFFPWSFISYSMTFETYKELNFNSDYPEWNKFLMTYLKETMRDPVKPPLFERNNFPVSKGLDEYVKFFGRTKNFPLNFDVEDEIDFH